MTDNELIVAFLTPLKAGFTELGLTTNFEQQNQPTEQGAPIDDTVFFYKVSDRNNGSPRRKSIWDIAQAKMIDEDTQLMEAVFQITAWSRQTPDSTVTASDLLTYASMIMQSNSFIKNLKSQDIGILRITELRNPYFKDDKDQYQASPSFDVSFSYNRTLSRDGKVISQIDYNIDRV